MKQTNLKIVISILLLLTTILLNAQCFNQITEKDNFNIINVNKEEVCSALKVGVDMIAQQYELNPYIGLYDGGNRINAVATTKEECEECYNLPYNKDGYIFFSKYLNSLVAKEEKGGKLSIKGLLISFHEMGHILFFNLDDKIYKSTNTHFKNQFNPKYLELYADFFAGYHLSNFFEKGSKNKKDKSTKDIEIWKDIFAKLVFDTGDWEFKRVEHHGTKTERINAFLAGWNKAKEKNNYAPVDALNYIMKTSKTKLRIK